MRYDARVDDNQAAIVDGLRKIGATVEILARVGGGVPDLLVGYQGRNYLMEVKNLKAGGKLNKKQRDWLSKWNGQHVVVTDLIDALRAIGAI